MNNISKLLFLTTCFTLLLGCAPIKNKEKENQQTSETQLYNKDQIISKKNNDEVNEIINKYWKLKTLKGQTIKMSENQEREQYFILKSDGRMNGFAGCNYFNGNYELQKENHIHFIENIAITMKICTDVPTNENDFLKVFKLADNYTVRGDTLYLNIGRRAPLAIFEAIYF